MAKVKKEKKEAVEPQSTESLAVKYRPRYLKDIVGQENSVAILKGMVKTRRYPGSILISGPTGCGKTTMARILAAYMNTDNHKKMEESSAFRLGDKHPDVTVVNAATHGKVDDIRTIIRGSKTAPMTNYRITIIDEAHKLTGASAEALLVPMEEPSPRTIWILCTTNPEKLVDTIAGRCTKISLTQTEPKDIVSRLDHIVDAEGMKFVKGKEGKKALKMIAQLSDGSMRNAISHLEALMYAAMSGMDFNADGALKSYVENAAVDLDKACVSVVAASLNLDLPGCISAIRRAQNPRGIVHKARYLVDYLIGEKTKTAKYQPYTARLFVQIVTKMEIKFNLMALVLLQSAINEVELQMNSCSIEEGVLLQTHLGKFIIENKVD